MADLVYWNLSSPIACSDSDDSVGVEVDGSDGEVDEDASDEGDSEGVEVELNRADTILGPRTRNEAIVRAKDAMVIRVCICMSARLTLTMIEISKGDWTVKTQCGSFPLSSLAFQHRYPYLIPTTAIDSTYMRHSQILSHT